MRRKKKWSSRWLRPAECPRTASCDPRAAGARRAAYPAAGVVALPTRASSRSQALPCGAPRTSGTFGSTTGWRAYPVARSARTHRHALGAASSAAPSAKAAKGASSSRPSPDRGRDSLGGARLPLPGARCQNASGPGRPWPNVITVGVKKGDGLASCRSCRSRRSPFPPRLELYNCHCSTSMLFSFSVRDL
jgi:hypothetical protein